MEMKNAVKRAADVGGGEDRVPQDLQGVLEKDRHRDVEPQPGKHDRRARWRRRR